MLYCGGFLWKIVWMQLYNAFENTITQLDLCENSVFIYSKSVYIYFL